MPGNLSDKKASRRPGRQCRGIEPFGETGPDTRAVKSVGLQNVVFKSNQREAPANFRASPRRASTSASVVAQEHMNLKPPEPMKS